MNGSSLKESYELESQYGPFFTGGNIEWSSDGQYFFCQKGGTVHVLSLATGHVESILGETSTDQDEDTVNSFALNPSDEDVITHHKSGLFKLWNWKEVKLKKMWKAIHNGPVSKVAFSRNSQTMASGGSDSSVRLWDLVHQACTHNLKGAQGVVSVLAFHPRPDKELIFAAGDDTKIYGWNSITGQQKIVLSGHFSKITSLLFHDDAIHLVSSGRDKVLILWDISQGSIVRTVPVYEGVEGSFLLPTNSTKLITSYQSDGIYVAAAGEKGVVKVWEMRSGNKVYEQENSLVASAKEVGGLSITQLLYNHVTNSFAVVSTEHNIIIHQLDTFECKKQLVGYSDEILDVVYFGTKDTHLAVATNSPDIKLYELTTMNCQLLCGHTDFILSLATTPANFNLLLSSAKDNSVRLWLMDPETFQVSCVAHAVRHTASVGSVSLSHTAVKFFTSVSQDLCLKIWDLPEKISSNETENTLTVRCTELAHQKDINAVAVSPNDKLVATGSQDKTAKLWTAESLQLVGVLRGHRRGVWCVRFSPIDQVLLTTSADCNIKLWSLTDLSCLKTLEGHESSVLRAEFLSRGMQLVTAGADGLLKLWSVKTSECVTTLEHHENRVWALAVCRNETHIISGGSDSILGKWRDITEEKKAAAAAEAERLALEEQKLSNLLKADQLLAALKLALKLERPLQVLKIIDSVIRKGGDGLRETIHQLKQTQKESLLRCAVTWNTNSRNAQSAQLVINVLLDEISSGELKVPGLAASLEAMIPYTERHFKRLTQLMQDLHFISYTVTCMQPHNKISPT
ncbi:transducin beta-like protein 3 [Neodiprion virginianus]|uniref:transducin beta-like protein 3 n=1 Tax=Neodiprion virginianus TaxID=2961670 RepID=UPI001EE6A84E|nr:transducin beta-like protein 3 [Neodiprion virginianus]